MKKQNARLTHRITIRMDDALYNLTTENAKQAGLSQVEYARRMLLRGKVSIKQEIIADVPELKRLIAQFGKIGSNLNQIAHHYNGGGVRSREMYDRTMRAISELYSMKYEDDKMGGDFRGYSQARLHKKQ